MVRRRWKIILLILIVPWLILGGFLVVERVRGKILLARYKRELMAKGEKLTASEFLPKEDSGAESAALLLWAAVDALPTGTVVTTNPPPRMRLLPSGHAMAGFREDFWVDDKASNTWEEVFNELGNNQERLKQVRRLIQKPLFRNKIGYEAGPKALFTHLPKPKTLAHWFGTSCQLALHDGRNAEALEELLTEIRIPRLLAEDRIVISELVRIALAAIVRADTWEALQAESWTEEELARIQQAWEQQEFASAMTRALQGELVFAESTFNLMRQSNEETAAILFAMEEYLPRAEDERPLWEQALISLPYGEELSQFLKYQAYCRVWRFTWLDQDEWFYLQFLETLLNESREAARLKKDLGEASKAVQQLTHRGFYDRLRFPSANSAAALVKTMSRALRAETERATILSAVALKRYQLRHGRLPPTLDALTPDFLPSVPTDYIDGKPLKYSLNPNGSFRLYSVGEDGVDNSGSTALRQGRTNHRNLWDREDFVWPAPATAEELHAYRAQLLPQPYK